MSEQEILEGNKLIADSPFSHDNLRESIKIDKRNLCSDEYIYGNLQYHSSWDWIMPVVEKIEQILLKNIIGVAESNPYWENDKLRVSVGYRIKKQGFNESVDFPSCFTINSKESWIQYYHCSISGGDSHFDMIKESLKSKIEATWKCVIEFIKWYNKQQGK